MQSLQSKHAYANITKIESIISSGFSMDRLANEAVIDREQLERFLNQDDSLGFGVSQDCSEGLDTWLADYERTAEKQWAKTPTYNTIQALLAKAHNYGELIAITGGVGVGKSEASQDYAKENARGYDRPGAFYVEFESTDKMITSALERILSAMLGRKVGSAKQSSSLMTRVICSNIRPGDFMILDECNYLVAGESRTIDIARDIYRGTGIGIALLGNPDFDKKVFGDSGDFDALASRTDRIDFPTSTEDDIDCWIQWKGLGMLGKRVRQKLVGIGKRPGRNGGLRTLNKLMDNIAALQQGAPVDAETIEQFLVKYGKK